MSNKLKYSISTYKYINSMSTCRTKPVTIWGCFIISSRESGLPHWQYTGMKMFASILRLTSFLSVEKGERVFFSKHCTKWLHIFVWSNETSSMLFPEATCSAVAITNRPQSHSPRCCWTGTENMRRPLLPCGIVAP